MTRRLNILLIEDDAIEVMKLKRTMNSLQVSHNLIEIDNGEDAINFLMKKEELPDIILLDLNMPRMNGKEFLKVIKEDDTLRYIPVVILTTSVNNKDILDCFNLGIAGYIIKPLKYDDYVRKLKIVIDYWSINELLQV